MCINLAQQRCLITTCRLSCVSVVQERSARRPEGIYNIIYLYIIILYDSREFHFFPTKVLILNKRRTGFYFFFCHRYIIIFNRIVGRAHSIYNAFFPSVSLKFILLAEIISGAAAVSSRFKYQPETKKKKFHEIYRQSVFFPSHWHRPLSLSLSLSKKNNMRNLQEI